MVTGAIPSVAVAAPTQVGRVRSLALAWLFVALAAVAVGVWFVPHLELVAMTAFLVAVFLAYMGMRRATGPPSLFEVIVPFSVIYIAYFGIGAIYLAYVPEALIFPALRPFLAPALALTVVGYLGFLFGYGAFFGRTPPSRFGGYVASSPLLILVPATLGAAGMASHSLQSAHVASGLGISPVISLVQQFGALYFFGWFLGWYLLWSGKIPIRRAVWIFAILALDSAAVVYSTIGRKSFVILVLGLPALAFYEVHRRLPRAALLSTLLVSVFVIFPVYNGFRLESKSLDTGRRLDRTLTAAAGWDSTAYLDHSIGAFMSRMTIVTSVAAIISDTGRWVDYKYGETLFLAPIGLFIPRIVWPDKPDISIGREFGHTFRFANPMDDVTEVAPSIVGDFYWNFGVIGVVLGMPLMGAAYRWYFRRYGEGSGFDPIRKAIYATLIPTVLLFEANVAMITAGAVKVLAIIVVFVIVARRLGWTRPGPERPLAAGPGPGIGRSFAAN